MSEVTIIGIDLAKRVIQLSLASSAWIACSISLHSPSRSTSVNASAYIPMDRPVGWWSVSDMSHIPFSAKDWRRSEHRHDMVPLRASPTFARFPRVRRANLSVRRWSQWSAGKSQNASSASRSLVRQLTAFSYCHLERIHRR